MVRAIIDIGTNTAHVLIADVDKDKIKRILHKERYYTFLGEGGLMNISSVAVGRLIHALERFEVSIKNHLCKQVRVLATEGLRSADNGPMIQQTLVDRFGWPIHIISGQKEAEYIYQGANQSTNLSEDDSLIMDIGGGSVEFIYVSGGAVRFQKSFPIGISRLYENYHISDPISQKEVELIISYLDETLSEMWAELASHKQLKLVGCAGTFEVFLDRKDVDDIHVAASHVSVVQVKKIWKAVRTKTLEERQLVEDIPEERAKYIVVAILLINYVLDHLKIKDFVVSKYALKEGGIIDDRLFLD